VINEWRRSERKRKRHCLGELSKTTKNSEQPVSDMETKQVRLDCIWAVFLMFPEKDLETIFVARGQASSMQLSRSAEAACCRWCLRLRTGCYVNVNDRLKQGQLPDVHGKIILEWISRAGNFFLHQRVQTGSGAYLTSYPKGTGGFFPWG